MGNISNSATVQKWVGEAQNYTNSKMKNLTTSDRVAASRLGKKIILGINEIYKVNKDPHLMEIMKAVTVKKRHIEKRLNKIVRV